MMQGTMSLKFGNFMLDIQSDSQNINIEIFQV